MTNSEKIIKFRMIHIFKNNIEVVIFIKCKLALYQDQVQHMKDIENMNKTWTRLRQSPDSSQKLNNNRILGT